MTSTLCKFLCWGRFFGSSNWRLVAQFSLQYC